MATKLNSDIHSSPTNDESDGDEQEDSVQDEEVSETPSNNVSELLKKLQSSGALIKKPKQEYWCYTCEEDFPCWEELETHLIQHVSLPSVVIDKLQSDEEDIPPSGDENWSDEDDAEPPPQTSPNKTPQKIDVSQLLKKTGISIKKTNDDKTSDSALSKLSGLGFTIKKSPIKQEKTEEQNKSSDVMQKLGMLGGIKLKLKSDGGANKSFKVINGLKDFKMDDEDDGSGNENDDSFDKSNEQNESGDEQPSEANRKKSESDDSDVPLSNKKTNVQPKNIQGRLYTPKTEPVNVPAKVTPVKEPQTKPPGRPAIKQTPKRNLPISNKEPVKPISTSSNEPPPCSTPSRRESQKSNPENVVVKQEVETDNEPQTSNIALFSGQIKSERTSPPPSNNMSTPIIARIKTEQDTNTVNSQPLFQGNTAPVTTPLLPVTKTEDTGMTVIEINGDSNDEDDDCCVVSATPAPDVKPVIPKTENPPPLYPPPAYCPPTNLSSAPITLPSRSQSSLTTEKQHSFNWNAPDSKPSIDILEKSTDDIFDSLFSSSTKKENFSISDASEYISLDTLGPQHSCDVCNIRFTSISLLDEHRKMSGHSTSLVTPSSSSCLLPYNVSQPSNILASLLPVKHLADQVGKISGMGGSGPGFTHQQNVMINIQAYPGGGGVMGPPQGYNAYGSGQNMHPGYQQPTNNMYGNPGQPMPGQYPAGGQSFMGQGQPHQQGYGQFQTPMSKSGYPGQMPQNVYSQAQSPYSQASPLQSLQHAYGQNSSGIMNQQSTQMGPPGHPGLAPNQYVPASSPSNVKIQNVQTFTPGQLINNPGPEMSGQPTAPGQLMNTQMPPPSQIRMGPNVSGPRPRMPTVRGARPSIRPGVQVHGQVRGAKPGIRMPLKRPAGAMANAQAQKRRKDMLLPGKHDNEDCHVMSMQKQREGMPMIQSIKGAQDKINLGSQISITKKKVNPEANAMANVLASRGISVKQKQKSRSPSPERPIPHIPNLGKGVSIKHTSKSSNFSIPEAKVGGGMLSCKICKKMFMNQNSLMVHMSAAHPQSKVPMFKCEECPASYPKILQLQHHKRVFHNVSGPNRELGLPVVDLSQQDNLQRLSSLGIYSFIPLANREQGNGCFGIPVISVHNMQNGITSGLQALGAEGLLSLGPLKPLPNT